MKMKSIVIMLSLLVTNILVTNIGFAQESQCGATARANIKRYYEQTLAQRRPHLRVFVSGFSAVSVEEATREIRESSNLSASEKSEALGHLRNSENEAFKFITSTRTDSRSKLTFSRKSGCTRVNTYTLEYQ